MKKRKKQKRKEEKMNNIITIKELKDLLNKYKDNEEVEVICWTSGGFPGCEIYFGCDKVFEWDD